MKEFTTVALPWVLAGIAIALICASFLRQNVQRSKKNGKKNEKENESWKRVWHADRTVSRRGCFQAGSV